MDIDHIVELGYPVFPVVPKGKRPLTPNGCKDCTTDLNLIAQWVDRFPGCNWGITCTNCYVLDVDGEAGAESFRRLEDELGTLPDSPRVATGKGFHLYFKKPEGKLTAKVDKSLSIDIRTGYTYVIAPGSVHPNGAVYREETPLIPVENLPELPQNWIDRLQKKPEPPKPAPLPPAPASPSLPALVPIEEGDYADAEKWADTVNTHTEGDGGSTMMRVCNALYIEWGFSRNDYRARAILERYNSRVTHNDGSPYPWSAREIEHKIDSVLANPPSKEFGYRRRGNQTRAADNLSLDFTVSGQSASKPAKQTAGKETSRDVKLLVKRGSEINCSPLQWLWQDRLTVGEITFLCGNGGIGKSALVQDWAVRITTGTDWPDGKPCKKGKVLYFTSEDSFEHKIVPHVRAWGGDDKNLLCFDSVGTDDDNKDWLDLRKHLYLLERELEEQKDSDLPIRMFILDPITGAMGNADSNKMNDVRVVLQPLQKLAAQYQLAIICLCHPNKQNPIPGTPLVNYIAGTQAFANTARAAWWAWKINGMIKCYNCKTNAEESLRGFHYQFTESIDRNITNGDGSSFVHRFGSIVYLSTDEDKTAEMEYYADKQLEKEEQDPTSGKRRGHPKAVNENGQTAEEWLTEMLSDGPKPIGSNVAKCPNGLRAQGEKLGFKYDTLVRAKNRLGITSHPHDGQGNFWYLPDDPSVKPETKIHVPDEQDNFLTID